jgi:hypothetical protein
MRVRLQRLALAVGVGLLALPMAAPAAPIQILFSGTITYFEETGTVLDGSVEVGTPFSGVLSFDTGAADGNPSSTFGSYSFAVPPYGFSFAVGGYSFASNTAFSATTVVSSTSDHVVFSPGPVSLSGSIALPIDGYAFNLRYDDPGGATLASDALAAVPFALVSWPSVTVAWEIDVFDEETNEFATAFMSGAVTALSVVPEASCAALLGVAGALLCAGRAARHGRDANGLPDTASDARSRARPRGTSRGSEDW